ncbi:MAG: hypothetical protein ABJB34_06145 [Acidobacteriota bacterium]
MKNILFAIGIVFAVSLVTFAQGEMGGGEKAASNEQNAPVNLKSGAIITRSRASRRHEKNLACKGFGATGKIFG